jgi:hypothetical protein
MEWETVNGERLRNPKLVLLALPAVSVVEPSSVEVSSVEVSGVEVSAILKGATWKTSPTKSFTR